MPTFRISLAFLFCLLLSTNSYTQHGEPKSFVTQHQGTFGEGVSSYRAVAEETYLPNKDGKPQASMWSVSYFLEGTGQADHRPVMFIFNGGPGSASVWLHMGLFGPKLA